MERLVQLTSLLLLVVTIIKCIYSSKRTAQDVYICMTLYALFHLSLVLNLVYMDKILDFIHIYRTGALAMYIMVPSAFLYVLKAITGDGFRRTDLLLYLPAAFYVVDLFPFFISSSEFKFAELKTDMAARAFNQFRQASIMPGRFHYYTQNIYGLLMAIAMGILIARTVQRGGSRFYQENKVLIRWLYLWSFLLFMACLPDVIAVYTGTKPDVFNFWLLSPCLFVNLMYPLSLLISPSILYGVKGVWLEESEHVYPEPAETTGIFQETSAPVSATLSAAVHTLPFEARVAETISEEPVLEEPGEKKVYYVQERAAQIKAELDKYINTSACYLNPEYSINTLSRDTGYSVRQISSLLNNFCMISFKDYINSFRIAHFIKKFRHEEDARKMTMEGLAKECGFANRYTFIHAFKKNTGKTPSEYFERDHEEAGGQALV